MDPKKPFKRFADTMHISTTLAQIPDSINSAKIRLKSPESRFGTYNTFISLDSIHLSKSVSPKKLNPIAPKINEISHFGSIREFFLQRARK